MKKIIFILTTLIFCAYGCSDKEENLPVLVIGDGAPFDAPVLKWGVDTNYIKNNLPEGYTVESILKYTYRSIFWELSILETIYQMNLTKGYNFITYYFDENCELFDIYIYNERDYSVFYLDCQNYLKNKLGVSQYQQGLGHVWKAQNATLRMLSSPTISKNNIDLEIINPIKYDKLKKEWGE